MNEFMNIEPYIPQIVGSIVGGLSVIAIGCWLLAKNIKIGEGRRMGLNFSSDGKCPACNEPRPTFRRPKNFRQAMWGGWTCGKCGAEFDKWSKPVEPRK